MRMGSAYIFFLQTADVQLGMAKKKKKKKNPEVLQSFFSLPSIKINYQLNKQIERVSKDFKT